MRFFPTCSAARRISWHLNSFCRRSLSISASGRKLPKLPKLPVLPPGQCLAGRPLTQRPVRRMTGTVKSYSSSYLRCAGKARKWVETILAPAAAARNTKTVAAERRRSLRDWRFREKLEGRCLFLFSAFRHTKAYRPGLPDEALAKSGGTG